MCYPIAGDCKGQQSLEDYLQQREHSATHTSPAVLHIYQTTSAFTQDLCCFSSSDSKQRWAILQWGNWGTGEIKFPPICTAELQLPLHRSGLHQVNRLTRLLSKSLRPNPVFCALQDPNSCQEHVPGSPGHLISLPFWLSTEGTDKWSGNLKSKQIKQIKAPFLKQVVLGSNSHTG